MLLRPGSLLLPLALVLCCLLPASPAQSSRTFGAESVARERTELLNALVEELHAPGAVYAELSEDDEEPMVHAAGTADLKQGTAMEPGLQFRVGSVTKTFTATAILMLADRGLVDLDATVATYLPGLLPGGERITVRNLLMMRSGLTDYTADARFGETLDKDPLHVWTFPELASMVKVNDEPDQYFEYRNINFQALGAILETVTGRSRASFVAEEICKPLGLTHTFVPTSATIPEGAAHGYLVTDDGVEDMGEAVHPSWAGAAGDMISTARDLAIWMRALYHGALLSPGSRLRMFDMRGASLHGGMGGYGMGVMNLYGAEGHGGDYSGIYTAAVFEYQGRFLAVLVNGQQREDGGDATAVFFRLVRALYPPMKHGQWMGEQLQSTLRLVRDRLQVPGLVAEIQDAEYSVWHGVTGLATVDDLAVPDVRHWTGQLMTEKLKFRIASVTKSVTATAILQLVDQGTVRLDDTLGQWLPGCGVATRDKVTVRQLLNHTSGIPDFIRNPTFFNDNYAHPHRKWTLAQRIGYALPLGEPGAKWEYSNTNYLLLGQIIEAASGQSYGDYLREHIFLPLAMMRSSVPGVEDFDVPTPHANGYAFNFNQMVDIPDDMPPGGWLKDQTRSNWQGLGYGNIIATPWDLQRWLAALTDGRLLSPASRAAMHEYVDTGKPDDWYGLGIEKRHGWIGHDGDLPGYHIGAYAKDGLQIVVLMNGDSFFGRGLEVVRTLGAVCGVE